MSILPSKHKKIIDGYFKPLKKVYYFGKITHGSPYFNPIGFVSTIIYIRKLIPYADKRLQELSPKDRFINYPYVRRCYNKIIKLFGYYFYIEIGNPISVVKTELGWKDKFDSPRFEWSPSFQIYFFIWQFCVHYKPDVDDIDKYWEMALWNYHYCNGDIDVAEKTWDWVDFETKKSTWDKNYLK